MRSTPLVLFILLFGCSQSNKSTQSQRKEQYNILLSKFKDISFDTLLVSSLNEQERIETYKFKGQQLDSSDAVLFPKNIADHHFIDPPGLFACYKFKIDSNRTALIARTPSEYYPSSIKLFVYTNNKDTLIEVAELAQYIGDAGALSDINSWLYKDEKNDFHAFVWQHDSQDNSVENENDTTTSSWDYFNLYNISQNKSDSLGSKKERLPFYLISLIQKKTR